MVVLSLHRAGSVLIEAVLPDRVAEDVEVFLRYLARVSGQADQFAGVDECQRRMRCHVAELGVKG